MGVLAALTMLPHLLFGLVAGVAIDRLPRRPVLVVADLGRALLLGTIPVLGVGGVLRIEHLYAVAFLTGIGTLLFEIAAQSLVPALVGRDELVQANSAWLVNASVASTVGPSLAGWLVQLLTAPVAIAFDSASFVLSAVCSMLIRVEPRPGSDTGQNRVRLAAEVVEGVRVLFGSEVLAAVTVSATAGALAGAMNGALQVLYLVRELHLSSTFVGLAVATSGAASVAGALLAPSYTRRLGPGRAYITGQILASLAGLFLAAARGPLALVGLLLALGQVAGGLGPPLYGVPQRTLRQALTPDRLLGRANATWRFLVFGAQPLGALLGGVLGTALGLRTTLVLGSVGMLLAAIWAARSPLRSLRRVPV
jgi:MFS family permease